MNDRTTAIIEEIQVTCTHRVYFTGHVFSPENDLLAATIREISTADRPHVLIVADATFLEANPEVRRRMTEYFDHHRAEIQFTGCLELPGGEQLKNDPGYLEKLYCAIDAEKLCRHSCLIALGGGALLDLAGFAASTAHRGIRHLRLPTTSLSQGDGGCGVKNGINHLGKKNFLGNFAPPDAVINDIEFLPSLPSPRLMDGFIEAIKVALIKDQGFFEFLENKAGAILERDFAVIREVMETSARHHVLHITRRGDPFELTSSRPLDFGHWSAHKLEVMSDFSLTHGEGVAIGVALDSVYSHRKGLLSGDKLRRILRLILRYGFRIENERLRERAEDGQYILIAGLEEFREHLGGKLTIPLLTDIGHQIEVNEMDIPCLIGCLESLPGWEAELRE